MAFDGQAISPQTTIGAMAMNLKQHVGIKVKAARQKRGLTQEQLAERIDKTAESVSNIERGHVLAPLDTLHRIAQELAEPLAAFFEDFEGARPIARSRLEMEFRLRALAEDLTDPELRLSITVIEAIRAQRPK